MSKAFDITAKLRIDTSAVASAATQIQSQLGKVTVSVGVRVGNTSKLNNLTTNLQALKNNLGLVNNAATNAGNSISSLVTPGAVSNVNNFNTGVKNLNKSLGSIKGGISSANTDLEKFGELVGLSARRFLAFGAFASVFYGIGAAAKSGVSEAIKFDREMVRIQQVGGDSKKAVAELSQEITKLGTTLGVSSGSLAGIATTLRQAGLGIDEVKVSMEALAKTTLSPTFKSIENTTEGLVAMRQQFGVASKDIEGYLGSINTVAGQFAVESEDLVTAIRTAGGAFKAASNDMEPAKQQFNELLALFTSVRQTTRESAETISTSFRTIFARLQSNDVAKNLKDLGVNLRFTADEARAAGSNIEGQFVGAYESIKRLSEAVKGIPTTDPRFAAIVEQIGGQRQVSKVIPLLQQYAVAQKALGVAQAGTNSLTRDSIKAQEAFIQKVSKLKEEFFDLIRVLSNNKSFQNFVDIGLKGATAALQFGKALEPLVPLLTAFGAVKLGVAAKVVVPKAISGFQKRASGGLVDGIGDYDKVPVMLTPGEFVVNKRDAQRVGYNKLRDINAGGGETQYKAFGGPISNIFGRALKKRPSRHSLFEQESNIFESLLGGAEKKAIRGYTQNNHHPINQYLNTGSPPRLTNGNVGNIDKEVDIISGALSKVKSRRTQKLYRGTTEQFDQDILSQLTPGDHFINNGFLSTSSNSGVARGFASKNNGSTIKIVAPKGANIGHLGTISQSKDEDEILVQRKARLKYFGEKKGVHRFLLEGHDNDDGEFQPIQRHFFGGIVSKVKGRANKVGSKAKTVYKELSDTNFGRLHAHTDASYYTGDIPLIGGAVLEAGAKKAVSYLKKRGVKIPGFAKGGVVTNNEELLKTLKNQLAEVGLGGIDLSKVTSGINFLDGIEGDSTTKSQGFSNIGGSFNTKNREIKLNTKNNTRLFENFVHEIFHGIDFSEAKRLGLGTQFASQTPGNLFSESAQKAYFVDALDTEYGLQKYLPYIKKHGEAGYDHEKFAFGTRRAIGLANPQDEQAEAHSEYIQHFKEKLLPSITQNYGSGKSLSQNDKINRRNKRRQKEIAARREDLGMSQPKESITGKDTPLRAPTDSPITKLLSAFRSSVPRAPKKIDIPETDRKGRIAVDPEQQSALEDIQNRFSQGEKSPDTGIGALFGKKIERDQYKQVDTSKLIPGTPEFIKAKIANEYIPRGIETFKDIDNKDFAESKFSAQEIASQKEKEKALLDSGVSASKQTTVPVKGGFGLSGRRKPQTQTSIAPPAKPPTSVTVAGAPEDEPNRVNPRDVSLPIVNPSGKPFEKGLDDRIRVANNRMNSSILTKPLLQLEHKPDQDSTRIFDNKQQTPDMSDSSRDFHEWKKGLASPTDVNRPKKDPVVRQNQIVDKDLEEWGSKLSSFIIPPSPVNEGITRARSTKEDKAGSGPSFPVLSAEEINKRSNNTFSPSPNSVKDSLERSEQARRENVKKAFERSEKAKTADPVFRTSDGVTTRPDRESRDFGDKRTRLEAIRDRLSRLHDDSPIPENKERLDQAQRNIYDYDREIPKGQEIVPYERPKRSKEEIQKRKEDAKRKSFERQKKQADNQFYKDIQGNKAKDGGVRITPEVKDPYAGFNYEDMADSNNLVDKSGGLSSLPKELLNKNRKSLLNTSRSPVLKALTGGTGKLKNFSAKAAGAVGIASAFAPLATNYLFGTAEKPGNYGQTGARAGSAIGGIVSGAGTGALVGSAFSPYGTAIGAFAGGIYGAISSLKEFDKELATLDIEKSLKKFESSIDEVANGQKTFVDGLAEINAGFAGINKLSDLKSGGTYATQEFSFGERLRSGGSEDLKHSTTSIIADEKNKAYTQEQQDQILPILPKLQGIVEEEVRKIKLPERTFSQQEASKNFDKLSEEQKPEFLKDKDKYRSLGLSFIPKEQRRDSIKSTGIDTTVRKIAEGKGVSVKEVYEGLDKLLVATNLETEQKQKTIKVENERLIQAQQLVRIGQAFTSATNSIKGLQTNADLLADIFDNNVKNVPNVDHSLNVSELGNTNRESFNKSADFLASSVGGESGRQLGNTAKSFNNAAVFLPDVIANASKQGLEGDAFSKTVGDGLEANGVNKEVTGKLKDFFGSISAPDLADRARTNPDKLGKEAIDATSGDLPNVLGQGTKSIKDRLDQLGEGLSKGRELINRIFESEYQGDNLKVNAAQSQATYKAQVLGKPSSDKLSLDTLLQPYNNQQKRLTAGSGLTGSDSFNPSAIRSRLKDTNEQIKEVVKKRDSSAGETQAGFVKELDVLTSNAKNLDLALKHLIDTSETGAAIQQKINEAEEQREGKLDFFKKLLTSSPSERKELGRTQQMSDTAVSQGSFNGFRPEQIKKVTDYLESFGSIKLPGYGGATGKETSQQLLTNTGIMTGDIDPKEKRNINGLYKQKADNDSKAADAQQKVTEGQKDVTPKFFSDLNSIHAKFFDNLNKVLAESRKQDLSVQNNANNVELGKTTKATEAVNNLTDRGLSLDQGKKLNSDENLGALQENIKRNKTIQSDRAKFKESLNDVNIEGNQSGTNYTISKKTEDDLSAKASEHLGITQEEARKDFSNKVRDNIQDKLKQITKISPDGFGGTTSETPNATPQLIKQAVSETADQASDTVGGRLNSQNQDLVKKIGKNVFGTDSPFPRQEDNIRKIAENREGFSKDITAISSFGSVDEITQKQKALETNRDRISGETKAINQSVSSFSMDNSIPKLPEGLAVPPKTESDLSNPKFQKERISVKNKTSNTKQDKATQAFMQQFNPFDSRGRVVSDPLAGATIFNAGKPDLNTNNNSFAISPANTDSSLPGENTSKTAKKFSPQKANRLKAFQEDPATAMLKPGERDEFKKLTGDKTPRLTRQQQTDKRAKEAREKVFAEDPSKLILSPSQRASFNRDQKAKAQQAQADVKPKDGQNPASVAQNDKRTLSQRRQDNLNGVKPLQAAQPKPTDIKAENKTQENVNTSMISTEAINSMNNLAKVLANFKMPDTVKMERSGKIEVILNGTEAIAMMKKDLGEALKTEILAAFEQKLPSLLNNMPATA